jgi:hypothetical protein
MARSTAQRTTWLALIAWLFLPLARGTAQPAPVPIDYQRSLLVMEASVVAPHLSAGACKTEPAFPDWSFKSLMRGIAGPHTDPKQFILDWLKLFNEDQVLPNKTGAKARPAIDKLLAAPWRKNFDDAHVPFRLLAIVNRMDLRKSPLLVGENAGEIHFVFGAIDVGSNDCKALPMTVILEYGVRVDSLQGLRDMADRWIGLSALDPATDAYKNELHELLGKALSPRPDSKPNGSPLDQIRTNEALDDAPQSEMREFRLAGEPKGRASLAEDYVTLTPRDELKTDPQLAASLKDFITGIAADIRREDYWVPQFFPGAMGKPLLGATALSPLPGTEHASPVWPGPSNLAPVFSGNTCSGCHGADHLPKGVFVHIDPLLDPVHPYDHISDYLKDQASRMRRNELWQASSYAPELVSGERPRFRRARVH